MLGPNHSLDVSPVYRICTVSTDDRRREQTVRPAPLPEEPPRTIYKIDPLRSPVIVLREALIEVVSTLEYLSSDVAGGVYISPDHFAVYILDVHPPPVGVVRPSNLHSRVDIECIADA